MPRAALCTAGAARAPVRAAAARAEVRCAQARPLQEEQPGLLWARRKGGTLLPPPPLPPLQFGTPLPPPPPVPLHCPLCRGPAARQPVHPALRPLLRHCRCGGGQPLRWALRWWRCRRHALPPQQRRRTWCSGKRCSKPTAVRAAAVRQGAAARSWWGTSARRTTPAPRRCRASTNRAPMARARPTSPRSLPARLPRPLAVQRCATPAG